jgi:tRNA pseudouridine13 synthase
MNFDPLAPLPLLTSNIPGIGGKIKQVPEDFEVEEIPAYQPSGTGEFLYLWIEKRGMGADYFVRQVARRLQISIGEVGTAGLKDRQAITRQMVSVPDVGPERLIQLEGEGIRLLSVSRHGNKLRAGHLRGNRFCILIREVSPAAKNWLNPLIAELGRLGLPNYYGPQRFGRDGDTVKLGMELLRGQSTSAGRQKGCNRFLRRLALSAAQSALFNHYLSLRLTDGLLHQVLEGDVMAKRPFGGLFVVQDVGREQARFDGREIVHTGPIFGRKMFRAAGVAAAREDDSLAAVGLTPASFFGFGKLLQGTRRHTLVFLDDLAVNSEPEGVRLTFTLPAGSYATVLLRELMKEPGLDSNDDGS